MTCCDIAKIVFYIALIFVVGSRVRGWLRQRKASSMSASCRSQDQSLSPQHPLAASKQVSVGNAQGSLAKLLQKIQMGRYDIPNTERDVIIQRVEQVIGHLAAAHDALVKSAPDALSVAAREVTTAIAITGLAWSRYLSDATGNHDLTQAFDESLREDSRPILEKIACLLAEKPGPTVKPGSTVLLCAACGADALTFTWEGDEAWYETLSPVNTSASLNSERAAQVKTLLDAGQGKEVIAFVNTLPGPGFAQYCPSCDRIYCNEHLAVETVWSGNWHEATHATCPLGHRREFE